MNKHEVTLTLADFAVATSSALARMLVSSGQRINHATTYKRTFVERLIEETVGCCAELAIGRVFDRYSIPQVGTFHNKADFLRDIELRSTARADGRLIVRDNDANDRRYVFAVVNGETVNFVGWMWGSEAKQPEYISNPNGYRQAWFVPQNKLRPFSELVVTTKGSAA